MPFLLVPYVSLVPADWSVIFWMRRKLQLNLQFKVLLSYLPGVAEVVMMVAAVT